MMLQLLTACMPPFYIHLLLTGLPIGWQELLQAKVVVAQSSFMVARWVTASCHDAAATDCLHASFLYPPSFDRLAYWLAGAASG